MTSTEIESKGNSWHPPSGTLTLTGTEVPPEMDFFLEPPAEIGDAVYVGSTLVRGQKTFGPLARTVICLATTFVAWTVVALGFLQVHHDVLVANMFGFIAGVFGLIIALDFTKFHHTCSFVGREGIARLTVRGSRNAKPGVELLVFHNAAHLYTGETKKYLKGAYANTSYYFNWYDSTGNQLLQLVGRYTSEAGTPVSNSPFHFAAAAETAWSDYLFDALPSEVQESGPIDFPINQRDFVRVGRGFIEFLFNGTLQRVEGEDLKHASLENGLFSFKTSDARWYSSKGTFSFSYARMANARLFLWVVQSLLGWNAPNDSPAE